MDIQPISNIMTPALLTEGWWDWVITEYRTTIMVFGSIIGGIVAVTSNPIDNKIWDAIKAAMPWGKRR